MIYKQQQINSSGGAEKTHPLLPVFSATAKQRTNQLSCYPFGPGKQMDLRLSQCLGGGSTQQMVVSLTLLLIIMAALIVTLIV